MVFSHPPKNAREVGRLCAILGLLLPQRSSCRICIWTLHTNDANEKNEKVDSVQTALPQEVHCFFLLVGATVSRTTQRFAWRTPSEFRRLLFPPASMPETQFFPVFPFFRDPRLAGKSQWKLLDLKSFQPSWRVVSQRALELPRDVERHVDIKSVFYSRYSLRFDGTFQRNLLRES